MRLNRVADFEAVRHIEKHLENPEPDDQRSHIAVRMSVMEQWVRLFVAQGGPLAHSVEAEHSSHND